jgi:hypothetical protein
MKKILIHPDLKKKISKEFKVTYQTVTMSTDGVFSSPKAILIRKRAMELMQEEIDKIEVALSE